MSDNLEVWYLYKSSNRKPWFQVGGLNQAVKVLLYLLIGIHKTQQLLVDLFNLIRDLDNYRHFEI